MASGNLNSRKEVLRLLERLWERTALVLGTGLGAGFSPVMPGTAGSLWGLPLVWGLKQQPGPPLLEVAVAVLVIVAGVAICGRAARTFGQHDPPQVVFDEIAAFPLVFCAVPFDPTTAVIGFVWFRLFDITKPWPIRRIEKLPDGLGIMADDLLAGAYAAAALWLTVKLTGM